MKKNSIGIIFAVCVLAAVMIAGCAAQSKVKMVRESVDWQQERAVLQRSLDNFDQGNSTFYVYEWRAGITAAIVADLKDPDRKIKPGPGWRKINSRQELEQAYKGGSATKARAGMKLYRLQGDDGEVWGYFFAPWNQLPYSVIDDRTIELGPIPEPPAPGGGS
jgi:hypothetical protein